MRVSKHMYRLLSISTTCRGVQDAEMAVKPTMSEKKMVTCKENSESLTGIYTKS